MLPKKVIACLNFLILLLIVSSCSKRDQASFADPTVVALVNGEAIHYSDVDRSIKQFTNRLGSDSSQFKNPQSDTALWREALDKIISFQLLAQEAQKSGVQADSNEVKLALTTIKRRFLGEQKFLEALAEADLSLEQYTINLTKELAVQKLLSQRIGSELKEITDAEALTFYNEHDEPLMRPEQIRVHHILVKVSESADFEKAKSVENKATRILDRIKRGEDFEALARQYSEDPASAPRGGDIGFFSRGDMIKQFEDAAFALKVGELSPLVRTPLGFHIIRLDERTATQKVPFEEVKMAIKAKLQEDQKNASIQQLVDSLKAKATIKIREQLNLKSD